MSNVQLLCTVNRMKSFSVTSPLTRFIAGFELLLQIAQMWDRDAPTSLKLTDQLTPVIELIKRWRKLEYRSHCYYSVYTVCPQKMRLANRKSWISYTLVGLLQLNLARDILMASAIKHIHKLPLHFRTQKLKCKIDELKHWQLGPYSSGHHQQSHWPVANTAACMFKSNGTSFWTPII